VTFNPWLLGNRDALMGDLFKLLRGQFLMSTVATIRSLAEDLDRYWKILDAAGFAAAFSVDAVVTGGLATAAWKGVAPRARALMTRPPADLQKAREALEQKIAKADIAVVVLIDELDRVEDDEVREVARLVKAVGEIAGISYLVAYDPARVAEALGQGHGEDRRASGEAYLEKIIQYPIPLRPLVREDVNRLLGAMLDGHQTGRFNSDDGRRASLFDVVAEAIRTPRDVKRLGGAFAIFWRVADGEICPIDVLAYCWLAVKHPAIRARISEVPDRVVNDPIYRHDFDFLIDSSESKEPKTRLNKGLPPIPISDEADRLLRGLFPLLNGTSDHGWRDHDRLSRRRNLERLLYTGDPPGQVLRSEVESLWRASDSNAAAKVIAKFRDDGRFRHLLARIDDLIADLPATGDAAVFTALSQLARRSSEYAIDDHRPSIESVARTITSMGERAQNASVRIVPILDALITNGDLAIAPAVLRNEVLAHGLAGAERARGGEILTREQTESLWSRQTELYRASILDGSFLRDWQLPGPIWVLRDLKMWDGDLRAALTAQLSDAAAFTAFAVLIMRPGSDMNLSVLSDLVCVEAIAKGADAAQLWASDKEPWVRASVARLAELTKSNQTDLTGKAMTPE
jgi:hypothetical protein